MKLRIEKFTVGPLRTNCYILFFSGGSAVIDAGAGAEEIAGKLRGELAYIIITHCHPDHTGAVPELRRMAGGRTAVHEAEKGFFGPDADIYLKDNDTIPLGADSLRVIHTPGHTPGSICLLGENLIFTGDTLFKDGVGRTDFPGGSEEQLSASLGKLKTVIKPGMRIYPGHGEAFEHNRR